MAPQNSNDFSSLLVMLFTVRGQNSNFSNKLDIKQSRANVFLFHSYAFRLLYLSIFRKYQSFSITHHRLM